MEDAFSLLKEAGIFLSGGFVACIFILILYLNYQAEVERFIGQVLSLIKFTGTTVRKQAVASELRGGVLKASNIITKEIEGVMPFDLSVQWVKDMDKETFLKGDTVIIRMNNDKDNRTKNMVHIVKEFVNFSMLYNTRDYIDSKIIDSSQLTMTRKILRECYSTGVGYFDKEYLKPLMAEDEEAKEFIIKITELDDAGLFISVLLNEFIKQGNKLYPKVIPDECLIYESRSFLKFLHDIAMKKPGEDVELCFEGEYFKVAVILFAKTKTINRAGIMPYKKRINSLLKKEIETIYVLADTHQKSIEARNLVEEIEGASLDIKEIRKFSYKRLKDRKYTKGVCICIESNIQNTSSLDEVVGL